MAIFLFTMLSLTACVAPEGGQEGDTIGDTSPQFDPAFTVCNPFSDEETARNRGIVAQLKYLTADQPRYSRAVDYIDYGTPIDVTIFFNRLFVPTRPWDRGFVTKDGTEILTENGDTLYEYFGLELQSELKLGLADSPGNYQMAILSDDGALLALETESGLQTLVDNDGTHSTKMGCATEPLFLDSNSRIPINLKYYQGPRYHISLVVMWRPWPEDNNWQDPLCGASGNSKFFDSTQNPPQPKAPFHELLARGWRVLENDNYSLPQDIRENPCTPAEEPLLNSGITIVDILQTSARVTWTTNIPADSKVVINNLTTNVLTEFTDSQFVTSHSVNVTDLTANTLYSVEVHSRTAGGQVTISSQYAFRTRR